MTFENCFVCSGVSEAELNGNYLYTSIIVPGESVYPVFTYTAKKDVYHLFFEPVERFDMELKNIRDVLAVRLRRYDPASLSASDDGFAALVVADDRIFFAKHPAPVAAKAACLKLIMAFENSSGSGYSGGRDRASLLEL